MIIMQELMLSGLPSIDITDWKKNTEYNGFFENDPVIQVMFNKYCIRLRHLFLNLIC